MLKFLLPLLLLLAGCGSGLCPLGTPRSQTCYVSGAGGGSVAGSMGVLDTSFNGTGVFTTTVGLIDDPHAMALQSDGKIIVVAESFVANQDYGIFRVHGNGSLDTTFNGTGKTTLNIGVTHDYPYAVTVQTDGKIVFAGSSLMGGANPDISVARYHSNGSLDTNFNTTGYVTTPIGAGSDGAYSVAMQVDGKIVVGGTSHNGANNDFLVVRYHSNGSLDTTFNGTGYRVTPIGAGAELGWSIMIQADGKIILAGESHNGANYDFAVARYHSDGALDTTFNTTGYVTTPIGAGLDAARSVAIQLDGKIVVGGASHNGANNDFALARYHSNGSLDTTFNGTGYVITPIGAGLDNGWPVAIQTDGKIVLAGESNNGADSDFTIARYHSNGSLDTTFNGTGYVLRDSGAQDEVIAMVIQPDGKIVVSGTYNSTSIGIARYQ